MNSGNQDFAHASVTCYGRRSGARTEGIACREIGSKRYTAFRAVLAELGEGYGVVDDG